MIRLKYSGLFFRKPVLKLHCDYVRKKQIDQICAGYSESTMDKIKMYTKMFAHIGKQGFKGARDDVKLFMQLRKKPRSQFTSEDWNELTRLYHDFFRLGPLLIIQILPMSGPLFILYMYTYPGSIPSWFIIDKFHQDYERKIRIVQQQAIEYFKMKNLKASDINFDQMTLEEAKKLAECLYGYHRDGTLGFQKIFKRDIDYLISPGFSKYLIKRKLRYKFNADLQNKHIIENMSFDEKIRWKYQQVMTHGKFLKRYEDILTAQQLKARLDQDVAVKQMEAEGGHDTTHNATQNITQNTIQNNENKGK